MFEAALKCSISVRTSETNVVYISRKKSVLWITFEIGYILSRFKSWCEAPQRWHNIETHKSNIRVFVYTSEVRLLVSWVSSWVAEMSSHCRLVLLVVGVSMPSSKRLIAFYCPLCSSCRFSVIQDSDSLCPPILMPFFRLFVTGSHKEWDHIADESASHILRLLRRSFSAKWSSVFQQLRLIAFTLCGMRLHFMYFMLPRSVCIILKVIFYLLILCEVPLYF